MTGLLSAHILPYTFDYGNVCLYNVPFSLLVQRSHLLVNNNVDLIYPIIQPRAIITLTASPSSLQSKMTMHHVRSLSAIVVTL